MSGGPVNVIGHSYGGTTAYNAAVLAADEKLHIDNLVTIDPVGRLSNGQGGFAPGLVGAWTNVTAKPDNWNFSDVIAKAGGKAPAIPVTHADRRVEMRTNHNDFAGMMTGSGAQRSIDGSLRGR